MKLSENLSYWYKDYLSRMDVAIIGGGIVGLATAIFIKESQPERSVTILERYDGQEGASTRNAGFACFGSISELLYDVELMGESEALRTVRMRYEGLELLKRNVDLKAIQYQQCGGYEIFDSESLAEKCKDGLTYANDMIETIVGDRCYVYGQGQFGEHVFNPMEGMLQPAFMIDQLRRKASGLGVQILSSINVTDIDVTNKKLSTSTTTTDYNTLIVATNAWTNKLFPSQPVQPARNHVIITNELDNCPINGTYHMDEGYVYFRNVGNRVLIGGARNVDKENENTDVLHGRNDKVLDRLHAILKERIIPHQEFRIDHTWTGLLGVSEQKSPIIGHYKNNTWLACRMSGMGVAMGMYAGKSIAEMMDGTSQQIEIA